MTEQIRIRYGARPFVNEHRTALCTTAEDWYAVPGDAGEVADALVRGWEAARLPRIRRWRWVAWAPLATAAVAFASALITAGSFDRVGDFVLGSLLALLVALAAWFTAISRIDDLESDPVTVPCDGAVPLGPHRWDIARALTAEDRDRLLSLRSEPAHVRIAAIDRLEQRYRVERQQADAQEAQAQREVEERERADADRRLAELGFPGGGAL
ncbi:MAG: hypothetical protein ACTH0V_05090 [Microbacteriaceae bacterium]